MKKIEEKIERTVTDIHVSYKAIDGTVFTDENECKRYEATVEAVLLSKIKEFQIKEVCGDDLFESNSEGIYRIVVPTKKSHLDVLNQLWKLNGGQSVEELFFTDKDLNTLIAVGIREYGGRIDWIWFWKINNVIEKITDNKYHVTL